MELSREEHTTALFVIALYLWFSNQEDNAESIMNVAVQVATSASTGTA